MTGGCQWFPIHTASHTAQDVLWATEKKTKQKPYERNEEPKKNEFDEFQTNRMVATGVGD